MASKKPSATVRLVAPETDKTEPKAEVVVQEAAPPSPPPVPVRRIERQGGKAEPYVHKYPEIRGGVCEYHGTMDPNLPSQYQYKLCDHFRGEQMRCSYCPESKDPDEVINQTILHVYDHPTDPLLKVAVCSTYECNKKHQERFQMSA